MMRRSTLGPIERCKGKRETSKSSSMKVNWNLDSLKSQKLGGTFKSCITQKVESRVQATRLQHFKYVEGKKYMYKGTMSS